MQNRDLLHYVNEYSETEFGQMPFSAVDALVLCQLAYPDLEKILPQEQETAEIWQNSFWSWDELLQHPKAEAMFTNTIYGDYYKSFMEAVSKTRRFSQVKAGLVRSKLCSGKEEGDDEEESDDACQFCGVTYLMPKGRIFIAYRGTDDKLAGWKESFNYGYKSVAPSAEMALQYITDIAKLRPEQAIFVGGHSKGGMQAVYAAAKAPKEVRERISGVFSYDGIGMGRDFYESEDYQAIRSRLTKIIPEDSVIGMLFETTRDYFVTRSGSIGIKQHDFLNWRIRRGQFVFRDELRPSSAKRAERIQNWIDELPLEERKEFIRLIFHVLDGMNVDENNVYKLQDNLLRTILQGADALQNFSADEKQQIRSTLQKLL